VALAEAEARTLSAQRDSLSASIEALRRQRDLARAQVRLAETAQRRAAQLAAEGAGSRRQAEESRAAVLARQAEVETLTERLATQTQALQAIVAGIGERRLEGERRRAEIAVQRAGLGEQRIALSRSDTLVLTAPVAGTVGDIAGEIGQRARPDAALVTIVPVESRTEVWAYANSAAVGQVRLGQEVRLQFDAFPHQRHGSGQGKVVDIAPVPVDPASLDPALGIQEPVFRIRVAIEELPPRLPGGMQSLRPGTPVTANMILNRRSLWDVLFNPVKAAFEE
jgi:membrane fusion protein